MKLFVGLITIGVTTALPVRRLQATADNALMLPTSGAEVPSSIDVAGEQACNVTRTYKRCVAYVG